MAAGSLNPLPSGPSVRAPRLGLPPSEGSTRVPQLQLPARPPSRPWRWSPHEGRPPEAARARPCFREAASLPLTRHPTQVLWAVGPPPSTAGCSRTTGSLFVSLWGLPDPPPAGAPDVLCPPTGPGRSSAPLWCRTLTFLTNSFTLNDFELTGRNTECYSRRPYLSPGHAA